MVNDQQLFLDPISQTLQGVDKQTLNMSAERLF